MNLFCFILTETAFNEHSVEMTNGQWMGGTVRSSGEGIALVSHTQSQLFLDSINLFETKGSLKSSRKVAGIHAFGIFSFLYYNYIKGYDEKCHFIKITNFIFH